MSQQTVSINFLANSTQAQTAINALQRNLRGLQNAVGGTNSALGSVVGGFRGMVGAMASVGAAYVTLSQSARLLGDAVRTNMDFEATMQRVKSVVAEDGGDVAANMDWLAYKARETGKATRYSATEAAEGLEHLAKAGYSAREASDSLNAVLLMSQASGMSVGETAEKVADMITAFGGDVSKTEHFVDVLAMTAAKSTTDLYQLSEALKYVGVAGSGMGMEFEQMAAALGVVAGAGVKASMAGTAIRGTLIQLADSSSAAHRKLLDLGLSTADITPGPLNQLDQIMKKLRDKGVDANTAYAIFGQRAGVAANVFTTFYNSLVEFNGIIDSADGAAQRMADTMDDSFAASVMKLKNAWAELMISLGESGAMSWLRSVVDALRIKILQLAEVIKVLNNAAADGKLGEVLSTAFKFAALNLLSYLVYAFNVAVGFFRQILNDPKFIGNLQSLLVLFGASMMSELGKMASSLIVYGRDFATSFITTIMTGVQKLRGGMQIAVGMLTQGVLETMLLMAKAQAKFASLIGRDTSKEDAYVNELTNQRNSAIGLADRGRDLMDQDPAEIRKKVGESIDNLLGDLGRGTTVLDGIAESAGDAFDPAALAAAVSGAWAESVDGASFGGDPFALEELQNRLKKYFEDYASKPPPEPAEDPKTGPNGLGERPPSPSPSAASAGFSLAGANRQAINTIMGRTINEVIAQLAKDQLDVMEDVLTESKKSNETLNEIKKTRTPSFATFEA